MKQAIKRFIPWALVAVLLLLLLWGAEWLQDIYLWIAKLENAARGIDGITEASRVKVINDANRHFPVLALGCCVIICCALLLQYIKGRKHSD